MALDTLVIHTLAKELADKLTDGRIDKIHQPERDEILLHIRTYSKNYRLVISASPSYPRIHFCEAQKENPLSPPMFCMLLRKHLSSGKIVKISQIDFERIIRFDIESYNEMGDLTQKHLIAELMGRNSNIILTDENMKIIDSARHVDFTQSSVRQILSGCEYISPPAQNKIPILSDEDKAIDLSMPGISVDKAILNAVSGISPLTAREFVFNAFGTCNILCGEIKNTPKNLVPAADEIAFAPCMIKDSFGKPIEFSAIDIKQYGQSMEIVPYSDISSLLEDFYKKRDEADRIKQKSASLIKLLKNHEERLAKKMIIQQKTLADAEKKEIYKIKGELLSANIYRLENKMKSIKVENYYDPNGKEMDITLNPQLTPSQNIQKYYKLYTKAKNAEQEVTIQLKNTCEDLEYIKSTLAFAENAASESELNAIRTELAEQGFLKHASTRKKASRNIQSKPIHFISSDGFDIYVGKNNTQNDYLTLKFANSMDLWFHTKQIHGSHTIIKLGPDKNVSDTAITEAASAAAYYSKARNSSKVPVDYTRIKNVKKPNGAKPGMVIYDSYNTIYVEPENPENKLRST